MTIKLLQLNIFQGKFLQNVIDFVKKEDIDILNLQEVSVGKMSRGGQYSYPASFSTVIGEGSKEFENLDVFTHLKEVLQYEGVLAKANTFIHEPNSYLGNATLFKNSFQLTSSSVVWMKQFAEIPEGYRDIPNLPRNALICSFEKDGKSFSIVNTHLAWGPTPEDKPYKIEQAKILYDYLKKLPSPLLLTGDFNVTANTKIATLFEEFGTNLIKTHKIINTLNFNVHPAKDALYPPGLAVDFIFMPEAFQVTRFEVIDSIDLSDHLGILVEFNV